MKALIARANPPVARYADADPLFQRGQAKRRDLESTLNSSMGHASKKAAKQDGVGMSERLDESEAVDESKSGGDYPPLEKGGRGDLLFGHRSPAKPSVIHAAQKIGRR